MLFLAEGNQRSPLRNVVPTRPGRNAAMCPGGLRSMAKLLVCLWGRWEEQWSQYRLQETFAHFLEAAGQVVRAKLAHLPRQATQKFAAPTEVRYVDFPVGEQWHKLMQDPEVCLSHTHSFCTYIQIMYTTSWDYLTQLEGRTVTKIEPSLNTWVITAELSCPHWEDPDQFRS